MLDPAEVRVVVAVRDLGDLVEHGLEVLRPAEEPALPRVQVREVEDGDDASNVLREPEQLIEATDDLLEATRLRSDPRAELRGLEAVPDDLEIALHPLQSKGAVQVPVAAEVGDDEPGLQGVREEAAPHRAVDRLLREPIDVGEVHIVRRMESELDVELPRDLPELHQFEVVAGDPAREVVQVVPPLDRRGEVGEEGRLIVVGGPADLDDEFAGDLTDRVPDVLVRREPFVQVDANELDLHRGEAEVVDVLDPIPERAALAAEWDSRRAEPNHEAPREGGCIRGVLFNSRLSYKNLRRLRESGGRIKTPRYAGSIAIPPSVPAVCLAPHPNVYITHISTNGFRGISRCQFP